MNIIINRNLLLLIVLSPYHTLWCDLVTRLHKIIILLQSREWLK